MREGQGRGGLVQPERLKLLQERSQHGFGAPGDERHTHQAAEVNDLKT